MGIPGMSNMLSLSCSQTRSLTSWIMGNVLTSNILGFSEVGQRGSFDRFDLCSFFPQESRTCDATEQHYLFCSIPPKSILETFVGPVQDAVHEVGFGNAGKEWWCFHRSWDVWNVYNWAHCFEAAVLISVNPVQVDPSRMSISIERIYIVNYNVAIRLQYVYVYIFYTKTKCVIYSLNI